MFHLLTIESREAGTREDLTNTVVELLDTVMGYVEERLRSSLFRLIIGEVVGFFPSRQVGIQTKTPSPHPDGLVPQIQTRADVDFWGREIV